MALHNKFFWGLLFFLIGVLFSSLIVDWEGALLISVLFALLLALLFFVLGKRTFAVLVLFSILGSSYFIWDDLRYRAKDKLSDEFSGEAKVVHIRARESYLEADFATAQGKIRAYVDRSEGIGFGDTVLIEAELKELSEESKRYFEKEGVHALASYPEIEVLEKRSGLRRNLYAFRDKVANVFPKYLDGEKAVFMTGITLGRSTGFSNELNEKLSATGTTHLVALSGFNVMIIARGIALVLGFLLLSRKLSFFLSILAIFLFVVMTGAEASVTRAGIMAALILWADYSEEIFSVRNPLVFTALIMVLFNPKILAFDLGFQLSFLALIGIVYLRPILERWLRLSGRSFLAWKENLSMTLSAQLMVLPLILFSFGFMPAFSVLTNVLILTFIPFTMLFGLLIVLTNLISSLLASFFAFFANILLSYELAVIDFFSNFPFGIRIEALSLWILLAVYAFFFLLIYNKTNAPA
ncbi:MAG: ComEC/Rec2 family competence protein [bacterium]|nr:ComEC/Rec2 family competence protein [bacterium]